MTARADRDRGIAAADHLRLSGADMRAIRRRAAMDLIEDRDPDRIIRLLDAVYLNGYRAGVARGVRAARGGRT